MTLVEHDMTEAEARDITERIKNTAGHLWELLLEAKRGNAHKALRISSWAQYCRQEFGMSRTHGYRLVHQGVVIEAIEAAAGEVLPIGDTPNEYTTRRLEPQLPRVEIEIRQAVASGVHPVEAVNNAIQKYGAPSPKQARQIARDTGVMVAGSDGQYHSDLTDDERAGIINDQSTRFKLFNSLEALTELSAFAAADIAESIPKYQIFRVDGHINDALRWLENFQVAWDNRLWNEPDG